MLLIAEWPSGFLVGSKQRKQKPSLLCGQSQCWRQCTLCFLSLAIRWRPTKCTCVWKLTWSKFLCLQHHFFMKAEKKASKNVLVLHYMDLHKAMCSFLGDFGKNLTCEYIRSCVHFLEILATNWPMNILHHAFIFWEISAKIWPVNISGLVFIFGRFWQKFDLWIYYVMLLFFGRFWWKFDLWIY